MEKLSNSIAENVKRIRWEIDEAAIAAGRRPEEVKLMAVTKTQPAALVNEAIAAGIHLLGENRAQELCQKYEEYHKEQADIHFIGHLQTNKVNKIVDKVSLIHSLDRWTLADTLNRAAVAKGRVCKVLVQVNVAGETTKSGLEPIETVDFITAARDLPGIEVVGLMTIAPWSTDPENSRPVFKRLKEIAGIVGEKVSDVSMDYLSMGMSGDWEVAVEEGANILRIGTAIFGERNGNIN